MIPHTNTPLNVVRAVMIRRSKPSVDLEALLEEWSSQGDDDTEPCLLGLAQAAVKGWIVAKQSGAFHVTAAGAAAAGRA